MPPCLLVQTYPTSQYESFETCLSDFLDNPEVKKVAPVRAASLAVAGAVENNRCRMTNIDWVIDGTDIQRRFGFK
jgi:glucokinase